MRIYDGEEPYDDWEEVEKRFIREMYEVPYVDSNWVEVPEFAAPRKPVLRAQMDLFDDQEVA